MLASKGKGRDRRSESYHETIQNVGESQERKKAKLRKGESSLRRRKFALLLRGSHPVVKRLRWHSLPFLFPLLHLAAAPAILTNNHLQLRIEDNGQGKAETLLLRVHGAWQSALSAASVVRVVEEQGGIHLCALLGVNSIEQGLSLTGDCDIGTFEQRVSLTGEDDVLSISTRLNLKTGVAISSAEDRYEFVPPRHAAENNITGPLDFVWSQNLKSEADDLIPSDGFKSPAVMLQQGAVFAAVIPHISDRHVEARALDLDVTSGPRPWMSFGAIASEPHGHSFFRRSSRGAVIPIANTVEYQYSIVVSDQPERLGYQRVVRLLWLQMGHPALLRSENEQQNALRPELSSFDSWRTEAWQTYANRIYQSFSCQAGTCGTLVSRRNFQGDWSHGSPDAWFNAWFQTLRTAYGWYLHGRTAGDTQMMNKAESVLNLALSSPQHGGAFPTIYLPDQHKWQPGDGWAGYADSYHTFSMSWTAYWMLRWAADLLPRRKTEVLRFVEPYGNFLLAHQQTSGVIPSWFQADSLAPRSEFRDFNAETAPSALLLVTLGRVTGDLRYTRAAERAMDFMTKEVIPRQRWFDFETFLSCARKNYAFYDRWTAQYPQNNLAEIQAAETMLALWQATGEKQYLERGTRMLDYLLLTQQVWNNPQFTPLLLGGFTTQNTDAEWSDARESYVAAVLLDYYLATGSIEYLERAGAAARSAFAVAPWENWAHTGYRNEPGALTGFHWGTGSAMTTVELMQPTVGDGLIDLAARKGVGFDQCSITNVTVHNAAISFLVSSPSRNRRFLIRFRGIQPSKTYSVRWNNGPIQKLAGEELSKVGLSIGPVE